MEISWPISYCTFLYFNDALKTMWHQRNERWKVEFYPVRRVFSSRVADLLKMLQSFPSTSISALTLSIFRHKFCKTFIALRNLSSCAFSVKNDRLPVLYNRFKAWRSLRIEQYSPRLVTTSFAFKGSVPSFAVLVDVTKYHRL